jgi:hypothetical protein
VLVIFDSLVRFHHANENDASEMSKVLGRLREIVNSGVGVLALHHHGKAMSALELRARGSSDIVGICDVEYSLYKDREKNLVLQSVKSRRAPINPLNLRIEEIDGRLIVNCLGTAQDQKAQLFDSIVEYLRENAVGKNEIADYVANCGMGVSDRTLFSYIKELLEDGRIQVQHGKYNKKLYQAV